MYKKCDNCQSTFKLSKIMLNRFNNNNGILIYCPFCDSTIHHVVHDVIQSERGYIK